MPINELLFITAMVAYAAVMFALYRNAAQRSDQWLAVLATWLASPVLQIVVSVGIEHRSPWPIFNPATGSWTFIFGHIIVLAAVAAVAVGAWRALPPTSWQTRWWWVTACGVLGVGLAIWWHMGEAAKFTQAGLAALVVSPTKLAHDFSDFIALAAGLTYVCLPVLAGAIILHKKRLVVATIIIIVSLVVWWVLQVRDGATLDLRYLHPAWKW